MDSSQSSEGRSDAGFSAPVQPCRMAFRRDIPSAFRPGSPRRGSNAGQQGGSSARPYPDGGAARLLHLHARNTAAAFVQAGFPHSRLWKAGQNSSEGACPGAMRPDQETTDECRKWSDVSVSFSQECHLLPVRRRRSADEAEAGAGSGRSRMGCASGRFMISVGQRGSVPGFDNVKAQLGQPHGGGASFLFVVNDVDDSGVMQEATSEREWREQSQ